MEFITRKDWGRIRADTHLRHEIVCGMEYEGCKPMRPDAMRLSALREWPDGLAVIPREEWPRLIREGQGSFLKDYNQGLLRPHDQGNTSRCWVHGSVRAVEYLRLWEGQCPQLLSPDSVAYPIEGTRDRGGYPEDACQQLYSDGACRQELWPEAELSPKNADRNWKVDAMLHRLLRWIVPRTIEQQATLALLRIPCATGLGWWGHLVCIHTLVLVGTKDVGFGFDNSWGADWGENGYAVLDEESARGDLGCFAPISETWKPCPTL